MYSIHQTHAHEGPVNVIAIETATLDEATVKALDPSLSQEIERHASETIHLDLKKVEYLSSTAIGKFMTFYRVVKSGGGKLVLCNVNEFPADVLRITGLSKALDVRPCVAASTK